MATSAAFIDFDEAAAPATPAAGKIRQYAKTDGKLYQKDDAGVETDLTDTGAGSSLVYDLDRFTGGDISVSSTTPGAALTGPGTLTVAAATGDLLEVNINAIDITNSSQSLRIDVASIVSAAVVNYLSTGTNTPASLGIPGWLAYSSEEYQHVGAWPYVVQAGDIDGGNIELSLRAWVGAAGARTIGAAAGNPLVWWVKNLGQ